jgi:hypothetical protein
MYMAPSLGRGFRWYTRLFVDRHEVNPFTSHALPTDTPNIVTVFPRERMAVVNDIALTAHVDNIAAITSDPPAKLPPPLFNIDTSHPLSHTNEHQSQAVEALHLDEGDITVRTKIRTLAIVSALYVVLFIAALDQTIIAYELYGTFYASRTCTYN